MDGSEQVPSAVLNYAGARPLERMGIEEFNAAARDRKFKEGPFIEGETYGAPYRPWRAVFGLLDGRVAWSIRGDK